MGEHDWDFERLFFQLTDKRPYPWQRKLFLDLLSGREEWPTVITAPTGAGKTSLMPIWLIALAQQSSKGGQPLLPRRLVWVVNRRVVVDQATDDAVKLSKKVFELPALAEALRELGGLSEAEEVLAVSALRGEKADNQEWSKNPAHAAIVIGTVDMVGSRLLFRGYGDGRSRRPQHAGLLGQDCLIVNDEAHLSVAFKNVLKQLPQFHRSKLKPWHSILLSATLTDKATRYPASFDQDCAESDDFANRYRADKKLDLIPVADKKSLTSKMLELAIADGARRTIVFFKAPKDVVDFVRELEKKVARSTIAVITGTQRGFERDRLAQEGAVLSRFRDGEELDEPHFLIATSAGEVGIDASCSRLITTIDSVDHLIQRFGRLNRFGEASHAVAHVVYIPVKDEKKEAAAAEALKFLASVTDVQANTLFEYPGGLPMPKEIACANLSNWLMDRWAMTSVTGPSGVIPPVEPYLHGNQDDLPRTTLAWRSEIDFLTADDVDPTERQEVFNAHRLLAKEKLEAPTYEVRQYLLGLIGDASSAVGRRKVIRMDRAGAVTVRSLEFICQEKQTSQLNYATLILPADLCRLNNGMLDAKGATHFEVADLSSSEIPVEDRARFLVRREEEEWKIEQLGIGAEAKIRTVADYAIWLKQEGFKVAVDLDVSIVQATSQSEDSMLERRIVYVKKAAPKQAAREVELAVHQQSVGEKASQFARLLGLNPQCEAYLKAGMRHDLGKAAPRWRQAMNVPEGKLLAKTAMLGNPKKLGGYRHELGSLSRGADLPDFERHLIATHHGRARPHFEPKARDPEDDYGCGVASAQCPERFAKLQKQFGYYELAYLESILRAADWMCSAEEQPDHA